ncbi:hypothetical protein [Paractinoplanes maris]|uniref:hypothetical protein n=1 Tax=Paractinoplanes maris TaxID=1734446 RepID=UPI0020227C34|nr:hypothetical protein [Actinoplanes maris]
MSVDVEAPAAGVNGGLVCGAVTAGVLGLVFAALGEYQVPDYADQDFSIGLTGSLVGAVSAAVVIAVIRGLPGLERRWGRGHVAVPLVLVPVAVLPLVSGLERDNVEAALIWAAAAITIHVWLESPAGSAWKRWAAGGIVLVVAVAGLLTWGLQHRWRAEKFEAVGLPLYVPDVPGYKMRGTWAGRYTVSMTLRAEGSGWHYADAIIRRPDGSNGRCGSGLPERWVIEGGDGRDRLGICLGGDEGATMVIGPGYQSPDLAPLFDRITVREVDGSVMADYPNGGEMEPD